MHVLYSYTAFESLLLAYIEVNNSSLARARHVFGIPYRRLSSVKKIASERKSNKYIACGKTLNEAGREKGGKRESTWLIYRGVRVMAIGACFPGEDMVFGKIYRKDIRFVVDETTNF